VVGAGNAITPTTYTGGAGGQFFGTAAGLFAVASTGTDPTGVIGAGNNETPVVLNGGSGGSFVGTAAGVYSRANTTASGTGVIGVGNNVGTALIFSSGSGGAFTGFTIGVAGYATDDNNNSGTQAGGYFHVKSTGSPSGQAWCYAGARVSGTGYKTIGNGTNSTVVPDVNGQDVIMFCPEAPEVLFEDYGFGQLVNGQAHIEIDPNFVLNVTIDADHPLRVFIQLEGDCQGVFVANKTASGFDVIELNNGTSNTSFAYHIVANRADDLVANSKFADLRFPPMVHNADVIILPHAASTKDATTDVTQAVSGMPYQKAAASVGGKTVF
jgi:hypothetical protein